MRKACLVFNAQAGSADEIRHVLPRFIDELHGDVISAESASATAQLAREAVEKGYQRLIVAGGDGTVSQAINGLAPNFGAIELAVLPLGTGNDLARSLGMPLGDTAAALDIVLEGDAVPVDVGHVRGATDLYFINAVSGGAGGRVTHDVNHDDKERWGPLAYWMTAIGHLMQLQEYHVALEVDGQRHELDLYGLIVANGMFVGGGFPIAHRAALNDGWLDVTTIPVLPKLELLAAGVSYTLGRHEQVKHIGVFRGRRVHVSAEPAMHYSVDGEPIQALDATIELIPQTLRIVMADTAPGIAR